MILGALHVRGMGLESLMFTLPLSFLIIIISSLRPTLSRPSSFANSLGNQKVHLAFYSPPLFPSLPYCGAFFPSGGAFGGTFSEVCSLRSKRWRGQKSPFMTSISTLTPPPPSVKLIPCKKTY